MEINVMFSLRQLSLCWSWSGWNPRPVFFSFLILCFWKLSRLPHFFFASNQKTPLLQSVHFTIHRGACGGSGGGGQQESCSAIDRKRLFSKMEMKDNILGGGSHTSLTKHTKQNGGWALSWLPVSKKVQNQRCVSDARDPKGSIHG